MQLETSECRLRPFHAGDVSRLAEIANDRRISRNLTDRFPHPYTRSDAESWVSELEEEEPVRHFAIEADGELVGGIGLEFKDGEKRHVAAVGYWLAPSHWGRGIATSALDAVTRYAFETFPRVMRIEASVYGWNPASGRVLEKCGFVHEARLRGAIVKDGETTDELIYSLFRRAERE